MEKVIVRAKLVVKGRVQGVFYRQSTREKAASLYLDGWVANQADGSVVAEVEGDRNSVAELIDWCKQGPPSAKVTAVDVEWLLDAPPMPQGFHIRSL